MATTQHPIAPTIRDQVYQILKEDICNGVYAPGQRLQEVELAQRLNVSRSPVREALRLLAGDGLVQEIPNKGVFVKEFAPKDIEDVCDTRIMMETFAILRAKTTLDEDSRTLLTELIQAMDAAYRCNDLREYIALDGELHDEFVNLSGNGVLIESYQRVHNIVQQFRIYSLMDQQRFDESCDEHRDIVQALLSGDCERAAAVNRKHLELAKMKILEYIAQHPREPHQGG